MDSNNSAEVADVTPKVNLNVEHADAERMLGTGWREFQKVRRDSEGTRHVTVLLAHVSAFVHCALCWLKVCAPAHAATSCCVCLLALPPSPRPPHLTLQVRDLAKDDLHMLKNAARDEAQYLGVGEQEFHKARDVFFSDVYQAKAYFMEEEERLREEAVTCCGVTFVAHGSVVLSKGGDSWVGTIESPLLWDDAVSQVPKFFLTNPSSSFYTDLPTTSSVLPEAGTVIDSGLDVGRLGLKCHGPDRKDVPESDPGSIRLSLEG